MGVAHRVNIPNLAAPDERQGFEVCFIQCLRYLIVHVRLLSISLSPRFAVRVTRNMSSRTVTRFRYTDAALKGIE